MGRHATRNSRGRLATPVLVAAALVPLLVVAGLVWWVASPAVPCERPQRVYITVAPELGGLVRDLLAEPLPVNANACAVAEVRTQAPLETVANLRALDEADLPKLWVPDSSLWAPRVDGPLLESAGSLTSTPVVLATSEAAAEVTGWTEQTPSWAEVLSAGRPLAVPDLNSNVEALSAMAAVHSSLGGGEDADNALVQVALTAARGVVPAPAEAIAAVTEGGADAPLGALAEQEVLTINRERGRADLVAVYPTDGTPVLNYPVYRVGQPDAELRAAVAAVVDELTSARAAEAGRRLGFRGPDGSAPTGDLLGIQEPAPDVLALDSTRVQALLSRLAALGTPSRLLTVIDVSTSMEERVGTGNRATLARDAAKSALSLLPDGAAVGLWVFARALDGERDHDELVPVRTLGADADGLPQRQVLAAALDSIPDRLSPGGTGLYDTALAAVRQAREDWDPDFVNSVVLITDGENDDDGLSLDQLLATLRAEEDPDRPVPIFGIALGVDADLGALERLAEATGGRAYSAAEPEDLQSLLFSALGQRSG